MSINEDGIHDDGRLNAVLHQHSFVHQGMSVTFYSYYNDLTPILYQLEPFIKPLRLTSTEAAVKILPQTWVRTVASLSDDELFENANIPKDAAFVQVQSIQYLLNFHDDKVKYRKFIEHLYNLCLSEIETDRLLHERRILQQIRRENVNLQKSSTEHATTLDVLKEFFHTLKDRHVDIMDACMKTADQLLNRSIAALK